MDKRLAAEPGDHLWYLVRTNVGLQRKAVREIRLAGFRAIMIMQRQQLIHKRTGKPIYKKRPLLDRYIFVRMPRESPNWYKLRRCNGVEAVMGSCNAQGEWAPLWVPRLVVVDFVSKQRTSWFDQTDAGAVRRGEIAKGKHARIRASYPAGSKTRVVEGAFATFMAEVIGVNARGRINGEVMVFGRATPIEFEPEQLEPVKWAGAAA